MVALAKLAGRSVEVVIVFAIHIARDGVAPYVGVVARGQETNGSHQLEAEVAVLDERQGITTRDACA